MHVPIRVRVTGVPDEETLELLARRVAARVRSQLTAAARELAPVTGLVDGHVVREVADPDRDAGTGYQVPSYDAGGLPTLVPVHGRRAWVVLRSVQFRTTVGEFLDAIASTRGEPLPARVLYDDIAEEERPVTVWWVQVNATGASRIDGRKQGARQ